MKINKIYGGTATRDEKVIEFMQAIQNQQTKGVLTMENATTVNGTDFDFAKLTAENKKLLSFLNGSNDYTEFVNKYWTFIEKQGMGIMRYRADKISESTVQYPEFEKGFQIDPVGSLETLFQHPIDAEDYLYVTSRLATGKFTLQQLFDRHKQEPNYRLMRIALVL